MSNSLRHQERRRWLAKYDAKLMRIQRSKRGFRMHQLHEVGGGHGLAFMSKLMIMLTKMHLAKRGRLNEKVSS